MSDTLFDDAVMMDCAYHALNGLSFSNFDMVDSEDEISLRCSKHGIQVTVGLLSDEKLLAHAAINLGYLNHKKKRLLGDLIAHMYLSFPEFQAQLIIADATVAGKDVHTLIAKNTLIFHDGEDLIVDEEIYAEDLMGLVEDIQFLRASAHMIGQGSSTEEAIKWLSPTQVNVQ